MKIYVLAGVLCLVAAPAMASFASIALSPNSGAWGKSFNFSSRGQADAAAVGYCQEHASDPSDCRPVTWAKGGWCASVVVHHKRDGSVVWGSGSGPSREDARAKAYDSCVAERGARCDAVLAEVCSN